MLIYASSPKPLPVMLHCAAGSSSDVSTQGWTTWQAATPFLAPQQGEWKAQITDWKEELVDSKLHRCATRTPCSSMISLACVRVLCVCRVCVCVASCLRHVSCVLKPPHARWKATATGTMAGATVAGKYALLADMVSRVREQGGEVGRGEAERGDLTGCDPLP